MSSVSQKELKKKEKKLFTCVGQSHEFEIALIKQGITNEQIQEVIVGKSEVFFRPTISRSLGHYPQIGYIKKYPSWIKEILFDEYDIHLDFFGRGFDLISFAEKLKMYRMRKIEEWKDLGLEPHYLPKAVMMPGDDYPGWKVKLKLWFYQNLAEGRLFRDINGELQKVLTAELEGITVLVDILSKPAYDEGRQMWAKDNLLGPIIESLRKSGKIAKYEYGQQSSRFGVSASEWEEHIRPALAAKLGLLVNQVRLETTIERNAIPQIYPHMPRANDGNINTTVWGAELDGRGYRLYGDGSNSGGLADVRYGNAVSHWNNRSFRPLAVL